MRLVEMKLKQRWTTSFLALEPMIEKDVKSVAESNCNRDIFYRHAQSAAFLFSSDSVLVFSCLSFYDVHRIAKDLLLLLTEKGDISIFAA
jgi:hypothetical protein